MGVARECPVYELSLGKQGVVKIDDKEPFRRNASSVPRCREGPG